MPIFEYLCPACNRIYSFLVKSLSTAKEPVCPTCGGTDLRKLVSKFAIAGAQRKSTKATPVDEGGTDPMDDPRVEREMMQLMSQAEGMDESDPRQLGHLMRRMGEITGEPLDGEMAEAVRRLESGEDPEQIEADMGDLFGDEGTPAPPRGAPTRDSGLYDL